MIVNVGPINPPIGFNPAFNLALAVPANAWNDQLITPVGLVHVGDLRPAIDVNRFVGPGVPQLPRSWILRQQFQYSAWQGGGGVVSRTIADGRHIRSLIRQGAAFRFLTEHRFPPVAAPPRNEAYGGNLLINLTAVTAVPTAAGAVNLAADGVATANLTVASNVPGRIVRWRILTGDIAVTGGNPAALPAAATLRAGVRVGNFRVRAADTIFPNRRVDGNVRVARVRLHNMRAAPNPLPVGVITSNVSVNAEPGGRIVNWTVDAAAAAAGVAIVPAANGPGTVMNATATRPAAFNGHATITATDSILPPQRERVRIRFL